MNEPRRYQRSTRRLLQASRSPHEPTPERLEENLRWLIHVAYPPVKASPALRQRVEAIAAAHRARLRSEQAAREELQYWQGIEAALSKSEREAVSLLLGADLRRLAAEPALREEARQVTRRLLEALPEPLREALLLQVIQGLSLTEIAQVMGCAEGETAVLLYQARASIFRQVDSPEPRG